MSVLWGFWGLTSILLLWAALIRATRDWGQADEQGTAYGLLDGGRGLTGALMAAAAAQALALALPGDPSLATADEQRQALQTVITMFSAFTLLAAAFVFVGVPTIRPHAAARRDGDVLHHVMQAVRMPAIWLQALIVVTAYVAYKATDDFGLFAREAYGFDDVQVAWLSSLMAWMRPVSAFAAGWLADRVTSTRVVLASFAILALGFGTLAGLAPVPGVVAMLLTPIVVSCAAVYGLRGVYFALLEQAAVPRAITGTAVGIVSVVGYTPDIFVGLVSGVLLDRYPGVLGHQLFFSVVAAFGVAGLVVASAFVALTARVAARPEAA